MVILVSFGTFLVFFFCLCIGLIFRNQGLKSESEAHELLEGLTCAACTNSSCGFQGKSRKPSKSCLADTEQESIPHKVV